MFRRLDLFVSILCIAVIFSCVKCITPIPKSHIKEEFFPARTWLKVPEVNDSVLVELNSGETEYKIDLSDPENKFNFKYVDIDRTPLPKGLFHWNAKQYKGSHLAILKDDLTDFAWVFTKGSDGRYYKDVVKKAGEFINRSYSHPSKKLWDMTPPPSWPELWQQCSKGNNGHNKDAALPRAKIFEYLFGMSEVQFYNDNQVTNFANAFELRGGEYFIKNLNVDSGGFRCGKIELSTVAELRDRIAKNKDKKPLVQPAFNIIYYQSALDKTPINQHAFSQPRKFRKFADVGSLQGMPENKDAVFQLASRLHGLEGGCKYRSNNFLSNASSHAVQGEEASLSAAPGGIFRMYGPAMINLLAKTKLADLVDPLGRNMPDISAVVARKDSNKDWADDLEKNYLICFHSGIEVITGLSCVHKIGDWRGENSRDCDMLVSRGQIVNQIPVSAFQLSETNKTDPVVAKISQVMLNALYDGTILAAVANGKPKIILTAVGGGAFRNEASWIAKAIGKQKENIERYGLSVFLVFFGFEKFDDWCVKNKESSEVYKNMVKEIGGNILKIEFDPKNANNTEEAALMRFDEKGDLKSKEFKLPNDLDPIFSIFLSTPLADSIADKASLPKIKVKPTGELQIKLINLKQNLSALKTKLGHLKNKLLALKGKLGA